MPRVNRKFSSLLFLHRETLMKLIFPIYLDTENLELDDLPAFLWSREFTGFKRPERLDVKKPGPLFSTNNYAFKTQTSLRKSI